MSARIHEIAKRYAVEPKELLAWLKTQGFVSASTRSVSATVSQIFYDEIEKAFGNRSASEHTTGWPTLSTIRGQSTMIELEGEFAHDVLGSFAIIRGFATLQDLAAISSPYYMKDGADGTIAGHQREHDEEHAVELKNYFERGDHAFIPEIILSLRILSQPEMVNDAQVGIMGASKGGRIELRRSPRHEKSRIHRIKISRPTASPAEENFLIRRIDGNHRLAKAAELKIDPQRPNRYLVPFCIIVLGPPGEAQHDYAESLIFHSINSTARPLDSEHALGLILRQPRGLSMNASQEFAFSPVLHFTRLLHQHLQNLPTGTRLLMGERSLSRLAVAAREMLRSYPEKKANATELKTFADELVGVVVELTARLSTNFADFVSAECFPELVTHAWMKTEGASRAKRLASTERRLEQMARWLGGDGLRQLRSDQPLGRQLIQIHETILGRTPKRVFLARWYPSDTDGAPHLKLANARKEQIEITLDRVAAETGQRLELKDLGSEAEPVRLIHPLMYDAIKTADIVLADLTGLRPNVFAEAGFALQHMDKGRLVFLFQPHEKFPKVPFDLAPYTRVEVEDSGEIPDKLTDVLKGILEKAARGEI